MVSLFLFILEIDHGYSENNGKMLDRLLKQGHTVVAMNNVLGKMECRLFFVWPCLSIRSRRKKFLSKFLQIPENKIEFPLSF